MAQVGLCSRVRMHVVICPVEPAAATSAHDCKPCARFKSVRKRDRRPGAPGTASAATSQILSGAQARCSPQHAMCVLSVVAPRQRNDVAVTSRVLRSAARGCHPRCFRPSQNCLSLLRLTVWLVRVGRVLTSRLCDRLAHESSAVDRRDCFGARCAGLPPLRTKVSSGSRSITCGWHVSRRAPSGRLRRMQQRTTSLP